MIHNILLIKNGKCIYNYKTGTKKSLDEDTLGGLLDTLFGMGNVLWGKKINKIMFHDIRTVFQALSADILIGVVEDADKKDIETDSVELFIKEVSTALHSIISLLEQKKINPEAIEKIPWIKEELTSALEKALLKIPCEYLAKKRIGGFYCNFIKEFLGQSDDLCNLRDLKNCLYLQDARYG